MSEHLHEESPLQNMSRGTNTMSETKKAEFGKWRSFFWPVHNFELKKLLPMFFLIFLYQLQLHDLKRHKRCS